MKKLFDNVHVDKGAGQFCTSSPEKRYLVNLSLCQQTRARLRVSGGRSKDEMSFICQHMRYVLTFFIVYTCDWLLMGSDISTTLIRLDHHLRLLSLSSIYPLWYQITRYDATSHSMGVSPVSTMKSIVLRALPWESCRYNSPVMRRQRHV